MKRAWAFSVVGTLLLTGCGSSPPAPMAAGCSTRPLSSGLMQARVTVKNTTNTPHRAVVYGPALRHVRYVHPVLKTLEVVVRVGKSAQSYPGWLLPSVAPSSPGKVTFRLARPTSAGSILAAPDTSVRLDSWDGLNNSDCTVG